MIKEALQYIVDLSKAEVREIDGVVYSDKNLTPVFKPNMKSKIETKTLDSIVEYIKHNIDEVVSGKPVIVHISDYNNVSVLSQADKDSRERDYYVTASIDTNKFKYRYFYDTESFNIALQSMFVESGDREIILKVVGNIRESAVRSIGDDGVSQSVTVKTGIASVSNVKVPNPVVLRPYRTFTEIEQPESRFIFRMQEGGLCALFEADGGAWEKKAVINIKEYLSDKLSKEIENGQAVILA